MANKHWIPLSILFLLLPLFSVPAAAHATRHIRDAHNRAIDVPENIQRIICSGSGCLRLITYFNTQHLIVAVDDIEKRKRKFDARPYALRPVTTLGRGPSNTIVLADDDTCSFEHALIARRLEKSLGF